MGFSFDTTAGQSQSSSTDGIKKLEGNNIHQVKFTGCEIADFKGVKDPNAFYKTLKMKFENKNGIFEHTIYEPRDSDFLRGNTEYTDKKTGEVKQIPQPSNVESMMLFFKHAIDTLNPTIAYAIDNGTQKLVAGDWDSLRKLIIKILEPGINTETSIKLIKNKKGEAVFPGFFASVGKDQKPYIKNNFIGSKVAFTTYEKTRIEKEKNAAPTNMSSADVDMYATPVSDADAYGTPTTDDYSDLSGFDMPMI